MKAYILALRIRIHQPSHNPVYTIPAILVRAIPAILIRTIPLVPINATKSHNGEAVQTQDD